MTRLRLFLLLLPVVLFQTGCAGSSTASSASTPSNLDANGQPVSSIPWNKPESWESQGQLGALGH